MLGARNGAGEGDRTLVCSLGSCRSAIELHPRRQRIVRQLRWLAKSPNGSITLANIPISRLACRSFCASSSERFLSTAILISGSSTKRLVPPQSVARRFRLPYAHAMASEDTGGRLPQLLDLARLIAREPDTARLVERILMTAKEATGADGGSVYLVEDDRCSLSFALILNDTLRLHLGGASGVPIGVPAPALYDSDGSPNHRSVVTHCALARESVLIDDAYTAAGFDFAGARAFDQAHGYRSRSFLAVPMIDHSAEVTGVLQLINARSRDGAAGVFTAEDQAFVEALTSLAAIALDKQRLIERLEALFESLVRLINDAIDEKSAFTGGHCRRVPELAMMLAEAAHRTGSGPVHHQPPGNRAASGGGGRRT